MGISFSCPFANYSYVGDGLDSFVLKSINLGHEEHTTPVRSVSSKNQDSEPTILKSQVSGKLTVEASVSLKGIDLERTVANKTHSFDDENDMSTTRIGQRNQEMDGQCRISECQVEKIQSALLDPNNPKHEAALKLQKVYKSFRTRRKLADCAILVEQSWWKLLDFAELKRSSISFFDIEKHETAISRWSRARTKAAKVGKGLSKDGKAQKLALQHWLEAIDPRHRYGHNLHFYYDKWLQCRSREPFFYWLDIGEGKEINLEKCPRSKLQQQCIKYLGPMERLAYEVIVEHGRFFYKQSGELLHTTGDGSHAKWIFVLSTSKSLYVGKKKKGTFQHSSFLAGGATSAAGRLVVEYGVWKAVWPHSGHYRPTEANFKEFISFLQEDNVNLSDVKMTPVDEDDEFGLQRSIGHLRSHSSDEDLAKKMSGVEAEDTSVKESIEVITNTMETETASTVVAPTRRQLQILGRALSRLEIPNRVQLLENLHNEKDRGDVFQIEFPITGEETAQASVFEQDHKISNPDSDDENDDDIEIGSIPQESILKRINSHKETKSYQLGKKLSCKWTTGAGPRIGCVRDYPSELQFRALEQVSLSPRSRCRPKSSCATRISNGLSPSVSTPTTLGIDAAPNSGTRELEKSISSISQSVSQDSKDEPSPLIRGTSVIPIIHTL